MAEKDEKKVEAVQAQAKARLGDFVLSRLIGKGGMGAVYEATRPGDAKRYAVKVLLPSLLSSPEIVTRFEREIKAGMTLDHPAIVKIHQFGEDKGKRFFAMDFVEGVPIDEVIAGKGLTPEQAAAVIGTAADALHHAHLKGIVHRDVKPSNLILSKEGKVFITDFGIAKEESSATLTADGQVIGTPFYMSPEQALGRKRDVGPASDIYSLGVTLYEALTRTTPFRGEQFFEIFKKILNQDPLPPSEVKAGIPRDLELVVMKALRKEPAKRYASAKDFADDLRRFLAGEPVQARPKTSAEKFLKTFKDHRGLVVTVGAASLLLAVFVAFLVSSSASARKAREEAAQKAAQEISRNLEEGRKSLKEKRFTEARESFEKVLAKDPENAAALKRLKQAFAGEKRDQDRKADAARMKQASEFAAKADAAAKKFEEAGARSRAGLSAWVSYLDRYGPFHQSSKANMSRLSYRDARLEASRLAEEALALYSKSLALAPDNAAAKQGIAKITMAECEEEFELALRTGRFDDFETLAGEVTRNDVRGLHAGRLERMRSLIAVEMRHSFSSNPPFSSLAVRRFDLEDGSKSEVLPSSSGVFSLAPGSYVAVFSKPGFLETRLPFLVERPKSGSEGGAMVRISAGLVLSAPKYEGMVFVQGGGFRLGGDGVRAGMARTEELPSFLIDRCEVSCAKYKAFLDKVAASSRELAERFRPVFAVHSSVKTEKELMEDWKITRKDAPRLEDWSAAWISNDDGTWSFPEGWADLPVGGVTYEAAEAYAKACGKRIPTSQEWEKAARGVDGRRYPWGDRFHEAKAAWDGHPKMKDQPHGWGSLFKVDELVEGESPYGCLHMSASLAEWTSTDFTEGHKVNRGGSLGDGIEMMRCSSIDYTKATDHNNALGFRCAKDVD